MAYRNVSESLRAYRDRVAADLAEAKGAADEAAKRAQRVGILEKELAETEGLLAKLGEKPRTLPLLDNVAIAAPCQASWDEMVGDDRVRFCGQCEKNVYNLSALPRDEAEALLAAREGNVCVRLYRRADGTVLTTDCPVGVKRRRRRRLIAGVVGGGLMAAATTAAAGSVTMMGAPVQPVTGPTMGEPFVMGSAVVVDPPPPATDTTASPSPTNVSPPPTHADPPRSTTPVMGRVRPTMGAPALSRPGPTRP
jgi:hypothetical protein